MARTPPAFSAYFVFAEHDGNPFRVMGSLELPKVESGTFEDRLVEKGERIECLILRVGGDAAFHGEVGEEGADFQGSHFVGVTFAVMEDELASPHPIRILGAEGEMPDAASAAEPVFET